MWNFVERLFILKLQCQTYFNIWLNDKQFLHHFKRKPCFDTGRKLSEEEIVVLAGNFDGHVGSKALRASMEDMDME